MYYVEFQKYNLIFKTPSGTSRGVLHQKETWFIKILDTQKQIFAVGECALFRGLSSDDYPDYENQLKQLAQKINLSGVIDPVWYQHLPSVAFGIESAISYLFSGNLYNGTCFPSRFTEGKIGIPINGLIWMGSLEEMSEQVHQKIAQGFKVIKLKVGAISFDEEVKLLDEIRKTYPTDDLEIRLDANGAWQPEEALEKLHRLAKFEIHSIEQPIRAGNWKSMADLVNKSPIKIALDEELIGVRTHKQMETLLTQIQPAYIILKPSLLGGFKASNDWIQLAQKNQVDWWVTSALESNIGLNAIAQWTATLDTQMPQGLGTGGLFTNNFDSPLVLDPPFLRFDPQKQLDLKELFQ